jgi:hypothetical protein
MPITYFEGMKRPCNSTGTQSTGFTREKETFQFHHLKLFKILHLLEVVVRRKKLLGRSQQVIIFNYSLIQKKGGGVEAGENVWVVQAA